MFYLLALLTSIQTKITWINDLIIMKLNESVYDYYLLPEATLTINGEISDSWCYYERGVNHTFLTSVNNKVVRDTIVYYRVTYPDLNISSTHAITFRVIDEISPTIIPPDDFELPYGSKLPDLKQSLNYTDNYDKKEDLKVEIDSTKVLLNKVGRYEIIYKVTDLSGNQTTTSNYINIYDHIPPTITLKKPIIIEAKKPFNYQDFVTIKDDVDSVVIVDADETNIDLGKVGFYTIIVYAKDQSNNQSSLEIPVEVIDKTKPTMNLTSTPSPINVYTPITTELLKTFVLSIKDEVDDLSIDDIVITHDINTDLVGTYTVIYSLKDYSNNETEKILKVQVKDLEKPNAYWDKPLYFAVFGDNPILDLLLIREDNYNSIDELKTKITSSFKMDKIGRYLVTAEVTDVANNKTIIYDYIEIYDDISPNVSLIKEIIITDFLPKQYNLYLDISDNYDHEKDLKIEFDDSAVNYQKTGVYPIFFTITDLSNNQTIFKTEVYIIDIIPPVLSLKDTSIIIQESELFSPLDYILELSDNQDLLTTNDITVYPTDVKNPGYYLITYTLKDNSNNVTERTLEVLIERHIILNLVIKPIKIYTNESFIITNYLNIESNYPYTHTYTPIAIDTSLPQELYIHHLVINEFGKKVESIQKITIIQKEEKYKITDFSITGGIILIGIIISLTIIFKKKSILFDKINNI